MRYPRSYLALATSSQNFRVRSRDRSSPIGEQSARSWRPHTENRYV